MLRNQTKKKSETLVWMVTGNACAQMECETFRQHSGDLTQREPIQPETNSVHY